MASDRHLGVPKTKGYVDCRGTEGNYSVHLENLVSLLMRILIRDGWQDDGNAIKE